MDIGLFCLDIGLFYMDIGLFCLDVGLFYMDIGLFYMDIGLFCLDVGLFCRACRSPSRHLCVSSEKRGKIIYKVKSLCFLYRSWVTFCPLARHCAYQVKRGLGTVQKRPVSIPKDAYFYAKRGLCMIQKRPACMAKETY